VSALRALRDAALGYASIGWHVFPIQPSTKLPYDGGSGYLDAVTNPDEIGAWWDKQPDSFIGIALRPSGLIAIDVDHYKAGATALLAALEAEHGALPRELVQRSGRGGEHIVMRDPSPGPDGWTRTQATGGRCRGLLGPGIDVKCNGYIIVQPSGSYEWKNWRPAPVVPSAWVALLRKDDEDLGEGPGF
jgi:hypothetical protein